MKSVNAPAPSTLWLERWRKRIRYCSILRALRLVVVAATYLALSARMLGAEGPATLENNDSCDLSVTPAATLLLPYFEVDLESGLGETTVFTVTNTTKLEQVARVTLWTDLSYPVITFNIYLTGYDMQTVNLFDVLSRGLVVPPRGTGTSVSPQGPLSERNLGLDASLCGVNRPLLDSAVVTRMQEAFTLGKISGVCDHLGQAHENAVGYVTVDVVGNCDAHGPTDPEYFANDIRYDNALIGDYQQVNSQENFAQGGTMVHIRAIPEGGTPQTRTVLAGYQTNFGRTFYGRFQSPAHPTLDARQPLPSTFTARWINGGPGSFETSLKIWRQGVTNASADCAAYATNRLRVVESIAFDEHGNGEGSTPECDMLCPAPEPIRSPSSVRESFSPGSEMFPQSIISTTVAGWVYLNLDDGVASNGAAHQGWVVTSMRAQGRYSVDVDGAWLGNGCSPLAPMTSYSDPTLPPQGNAKIPTPPGAILPGPAADVTP